MYINNISQSQIQEIQDFLSDIEQTPPTEIREWLAENHHKVAHVLYACELIWNNCCDPDSKIIELNSKLKALSDSDTINSTEPVPCPFCGQVPRVEPIDPEREGGAWANVTCSGTQELGTGHYINICSGIFDDDRATCQEHKQSAIARWNKAFGVKHE